MKVVILAGGLGTRLSEETQVKPKPMAEIGEHPILWHIMKLYGHYGFNDFVICLGYKGYVIKEYFANYFLHNSDVTFDLQGQGMEVHEHTVEPWRVTLVDTGAETQTGGRLKRVAPYLGGERFLMTYGDGVADVDVPALLALPRGARQAGDGDGGAAARPLRRARHVDDDETVCSFTEKPRGDGAWMNGGFFVLEPAVLDYIDGDATLWEHEPLERLAADGQLAAYRHAASGSRWTRCATSARSRTSGTPDARPGRPGDVRRRLRRPPGLRDRPHRLQGGVAGVVARRSWRRGHRVRPGPADRAEPVRRARSRAIACTARRRATCATADRLVARDGGGAAVCRLPPGRAAAGAARLRRAARDLRDQRDGHGQCPRGGARLRLGVGASSSSPATSATRTRRPAAPSARRPPGRPRPVQRQQGLRRACRGRLPRQLLRLRSRLRQSRPLAPATSSAAATGPPTASCPTACARSAAGEPDRRAQSRRRAAVAARARAAVGLPLAWRAPDAAMTGGSTRAPGTSGRTRRTAPARSAGSSSASWRSGARGSWTTPDDAGAQPHEARFLSLDSGKARESSVGRRCGMRRRRCVARRRGIATTTHGGCRRASW